MFFEGDQEILVGITALLFPTEKRKISYHRKNSPFDICHFTTISSLIPHDLELKYYNEDPM
jgi:hypothetical protein